MLGQERVQSRLVAELQGQFVITSNFRLGVGRLYRLLGLGSRNKRNVFAAERAVDIGLLSVARGLQDIVADEAESPSQVEPRLCDVLHESRRVRTILAVAIECGQSR